MKREGWDSQRGSEHASLCYISVDRSSITAPLPLFFCLRLFDHLYYAVQSRAVQRRQEHADFSQIRKPAATQIACLHGVHFGVESLHEFGRTRS